MGESLCSSPFINFFLEDRRPHLLCIHATGSFAHEGAGAIPNRPRQADEGVAPLHHQGASSGHQLLLPHRGQARSRSSNGLLPRAPSLVWSLCWTSRMRFAMKNNRKVCGRLWMAICAANASMGHHGRKNYCGNLLWQSRPCCFGWLLREWIAAVM